MNEPAFPSDYTVQKHSGDNFTRSYKGMTLRDYFAAKAMQARISSLCGGLFYVKESGDIIAEESYKMADAMLKSRTEPKGE